MNLLISTIGRRDYIAKYFRETGGIRKIVGTSNTELTVGLIECDKSYILPGINNEEAYLSELLAICKKEEINLMISLYDYDIHILSRHLDRFRAIDVFPLIVSKELSEICFDKLKTSTFLNEVGIGHPLTYSSLDSALEALQQKKVTLPLVVKPRYGSGSLHLYIAHSNKDLSTYYSLRSDMIIQEFISGIEYGIDLLYDKDGKLVQYCSKEKLEMRAGETDKSKFVDNNQFELLIHKLSSNINAVGVIDIDVIASSDNPKNLKIIELNPRFGGGYPMSHLAGANFPELIVKYMSGENPEPYKRDIKNGLVVMKRIEFTTKG